MKKEYHRKEDVLKDLFTKKCNEMWTRSQIIDYLQSHYKFTYETSKTYYEDLMIELRESFQEQYDELLAQSVNQMDYMMQQLTEPKDFFVRLQILKEKNKITGLAINRVQIDGQISHVNTIRLIEHQPIQFSLPEAEQPLVIPIVESDPEPMKAKEDEPQETE
jgi:polyhydroxyalkanoate synthesis regulator phasin